MKKAFSLAFLLFLFAGVKAQQVKTKNTDVIGHKEGGNPAVKAQKQVKNTTQNFPKPLDSVRSAAKIKSATGNQTIPKPLDSARFKPVINPATNRYKTSDRQAAAVEKFIKG